MTDRRILILTCGALLSGCAQPDSLAEAGSGALKNDATHFGAPDSVLSWTPEQQLAGFRNYDRIFSTRLIPASDDPYPLPERSLDLADVRYVVGGETFDLEGFREHNHLVGLLAIKNGEIVLERYGRGNTRDTKWVSYSVAKSVVSLLIGAAIRDGYINDIDDLVTLYLPLLRGTSYESVTLRHALQMASGIEWNEDYTDPEADVSREVGLSSLDRLRFLGGHPRIADPGERFNYNTGETHLVGGVLRAAIGNNLSTYLSSKIWGPFGMESDANWRLVEPGGAEHGGCCISATLRDYGRIGLFALQQGLLPDGTEVLPDGWMDESTAPSPAFDGYGYLWWLREDSRYSAIGIFGQAISIDPEENLVIVTHSVWPQATGQNFSEHRSAFVKALTDALRN